MSLAITILIPLRRPDIGEHSYFSSVPPVKCRNSTTKYMTVVSSNNIHIQHDCCYTNSAVDKAQSNSQPDS